MIAIVFSVCWVVASLVNGVDGEGVDAGRKWFANPLGTGQFARSVLTLDGSGGSGTRVVIVSTGVQSGDSGPALLQGYSWPEMDMLWELDLGDRIVGRGVSSIGDVDGDLIQDIAVSIEPEGGLLSVERRGKGRCILISGAGGEEIGTIEGTTQGGLFGFSIAALGVNRDGAALFAVSELEAAESRVGVSRIFVYAGLSGEPLYSIVGDSASVAFGYELCGLGDVDGDGWPDLCAASISGRYDRSTSEGAVRAYSSQTGEVIWTLAGGSPGQILGHSIARLGDTNGDGLDEVVATWYSPSGRGGVWLISGDGEILFKVNSRERDDGFGFSVCEIPDRDGDSVADFAVAVTGRLTGDHRVGAVDLLSSKNGRVMRSFAGSSRSFGASISSGSCILVIAEPGYRANEPLLGRVLFVDLD